jgi:hypothetical protein
MKNKKSCSSDELHALENSRINLIKCITPVLLAYAERLFMWQQLEETRYSVGLRGGGSA